MKKNELFTLDVPSITKYYEFEIPDKIIKKIFKIKYNDIKSVNKINLYFILNNINILIINDTDKLVFILPLEYDDIYEDILNKFNIKTSLNNRLQKFNNDNNTNYKIINNCLLFYWLIKEKYFTSEDYTVLFDINRFINDNDENIKIYNKLLIDIPSSSHQLLETIINNYYQVRNLLIKELE